VHNSSKSAIAVTFCILIGSTAVSEAQSRGAVQGLPPSTPPRILRRSGDKRIVFVPLT